MNIENLILHRDDLVLIKEFKVKGETASGILLEHSDTLPAIYADVIKIPEPSINAGCPVAVGDFILFPRYAGTEVNLDEGVYHFLNIDDIECIIDLSDMDDE